MLRGTGEIGVRVVVQVQGCLSWARVLRLGRFTVDLELGLKGLGLKHYRIYLE